MTPAQWHRVRALFDQLCDANHASQRAALQACDDAPEVVERVSAMLASEGSRFQSDQLVDHAPELLHQLAFKDRSGQSLGPYVLQHLLGRGGMGEIYLARRNDGSYQQDVAIKFVTLESPDHLKRFERERELLASLRHPHIARLLDGGVDDELSPYLVMEYIDGLPLDKYCEQNRLTIAARLKLFLTIAAGVSAAHRQLIIHRDIKAENILVEPDGHPRLIDFGISKMLNSEATQGVSTLTQRYLLTPSNAAPEQVTNGIVGTHTDSFQLGLLLDNLLCGVPARSFDDPSIAELVSACTVPIVPAAQRFTQSKHRHTIARSRNLTPEQMDRQLGGDLSLILGKACAVDSQERYGNVDDLADDITHYLHHRPVMARPPSKLYQLTKFVRRHRISVAATTFALMALCGLLVFSLSQTREAQRQRQLALLESEKQQQVKNFLQSIFSNADPSVSRGRDVSAQALLERAAQQVTLEPHNPEVAGAIRQAIGGAYRGLGLVHSAEQYLKQALDNYAQAGLTQSETYAQTAYLLGEVYQAQSDRSALDYHRQALEIRQTLSMTPRRELAESLLATARALRFQRDETLTLNTYQQALDTIAAYAGTESADYARGLGKLGSYFGATGQLERLFPIAEQAYATGHRTMANDDPELAALALLLGTVASDTGRFSVAQAHLGLALERFTELYGQRHPRTLSALANLSVLHGHQGQFDAMLEKSTRYRDLLQEVFGAQSAKAAFGWSLLGTSYFAAGHYAKALTAHEQAVELRQQTQDVTEDNGARDHMYAARALLKLGRPAQALPRVDLALDAGMGSRTSVIGLGVRAKALLALGRADEALQAAEQALARAQPLDQPLLLANIEVILAEIHKNLGQAGQAQQQLQSARERVINRPEFAAATLLQTIEQQLSTQRPKDSANAAL